MKKFFLIWVLAALTLPAFAQQEASDSTVAASPVFEINQSASVRDAFDRYVAAGANEAKWVWRIRVYFGSDQDARATSESIARSLRAAYPETGVYRTFDSPNFSVKMGNYRTKEEAEKVLKKLSAKYPSAYILREEKKKIE